MSKKRTERQIKIRVTKKDYDAEIRQGIPPDEAIKPGTYEFTRGPHRNVSGKTRVTMYLDTEIVEYFKKQAERPNAAGYQTQINNALQRLVKHG